METPKIKANLQEIIDALMDCEKKGRKCRKCKLRKEGCLLFVRDSVAVALQFILATMNTPEAPDGVYT